MQRGSKQKVLDGLIVALVVVVAALTGWVMTRDVQPSVSQAQQTVGEPTLSPDASPTAPAAETGSTTYAVIGDALAVAPGWPAVLAEQTGLNLVADDSARGAGYVDTGTGAPTFLDRVEAVAATGPDIVVVAGSRSDSAATRVETQDAATAVYAALASQLPDAQVIVLGPLWPTYAPPPGDPEGARRGVEAAARAAGVVYVDPQADPWITQAQRNLVNADGVRLTDAGDSYLATRVEQVLTDQGALSEE